MADPRRTEMEKWLIELDPEARTAYEAAFDSEESLERDFPDRRGDAEHMKTMLVQGAKREATLTIKASITQDIPPYGKIFCYKEAQSGLKELLDTYKSAESSWHVFVTIYKEMVELEKKLPRPEVIAKELAPAVSRSRDVQRDQNISRNATVAVELAQENLDGITASVDIAKTNMRLAAEDLKNEHLADDLKDVKDEAERMQAYLEIAASTVKALGELAHKNPVSALGEELGVIKIMYDRLNSNSAWSRANALEDKLIKARIASAATKLQAVKSAFLTIQKLYPQSAGLVHKAQAIAEHDADFALDTFVQSTKGHFPVKEIKEVIRKAGIMKGNSDEFKSTTLGLQDLVKKSTWLTEHPKHEDNKKVTDRMLMAMNMHVQDGVGFQKQAAVVIDRWQKTLNDINDALQ